VVEGACAALLRWPATARAAALSAAADARAAALSAAATALALAATAALPATNALAPATAAALTAAAAWRDGAASALWRTIPRGHCHNVIRMAGGRVASGADRSERRAQRRCAFAHACAATTAVSRR
jgi:hypothetical protein